MELVRLGPAVAVPESWWCPKDPEILASGDMQECPVCGERLVRRPPPSDQIELAADDLRPFCESYVERAIASSAPRSPALVAAYVALRGDAACATLRTLLTPTPNHLLSAAAYHLAELGDREAIPPLRQLLRHDLDGAQFWDAIAVAGALHRLGIEEGRDALVEFTGQPYGSLAYHPLSRHDDPEAQEILERAASDDGHPHHPWALAAQLSIGMKVHLRHAWKLLEGPNRRAVIQGLGRGGIVEATPRLEQLVQDELLPALDRCAAAEALVRLGRGEHLETLHRAARSGSEEERWQACYALADIGTEASLPFLLEVIRNDPSHRSPAVAAVVQIYQREESEADGRR